MPPDRSSSRSIDRKKAVVFIFGFPLIIFLMWRIRKPRSRKRCCMWLLIVLFYLRRAGFYVAISFIVYDDNAIGGDLAVDHLEGCRNGAVGEQTFPLAQGYRNYHEV